MNGTSQESSDRFVIGVDYGTLSGRALVVRVSDGAELGTAVHEYAHAVMDATLAASGEALPPEWALQDPNDYREVLRRAVPEAVKNAGIDPANVIGIATDFTASTPLPVLADGTPLCEVEGFRDRPHAYVKLWKHHAAQAQADRINALARERGETWLPRYGGFISSEWEYAKALQLLEEDPEIYRAHGPLGRGRRLDRLATVRRVRPQRVHGGLQGHPPGRRLPLARTSRPRSTRRSTASPRPSSTTASASSASAPGDSRPRPPPGRACPRASPSRWATSTRT